MLIVKENIASKRSKDSLIAKWGLLPNSNVDEQLNTKKVLHHFFVEFNPFYLISALCIFYGVFLLANNIDAIDRASNISGQIILFFILQVYEATIIAGIAFLIYKANAIRPATILCLLECFLLFDPTFRLESLSQLSNIAIALFVLWFFLVLMKTWLIAKIMRLNLNWKHYISIGFVALSIAVMIKLFSEIWINQVLVLQVAAWTGALVLLMLILKRPEVTSKLGAIKENKVIVNKCVNASFMMLAGFYFYHLWAFLLFAADANIRGISIIAQVATLTLLFAITKSKPQEILKYVILTLLIGLVASVAIAYACFISAAVILYHIKTGMHNNYLIIVACLCYLGGYLVPWQGIGNDLPMLPGFSSPSTILFGLYIILIAVIFRNIAAISIVLLALAYLCFKVLYPLLPSTELAQGSLIIASGFAVLITGLAINWKLRSDQNETR